MSDHCACGNDVGIVPSKTDTETIECARCGKPLWRLFIAPATPPAPGIAPAFVDAWNTSAAYVCDWAHRKGFWLEDRNDGELLSLMHSEISEVLEALRHRNPPDDKVPEFSGAEAELADLVIRVMDTAASRGWRVAEAVVAKMAFNETRPFKHGKEF